jgi:type II secretory pathway component GspD/PulD (secretin)
VGNVPNTTSRTLSAEVAVKDGESIVLGGFIRNSDSKNNSGVPLLKDIPLLGVLFSSRGADKSRSELMVVMRPTVLRTPELAARHVDVERERLPLIRKAVDDLNEIEEGAAKEYREEQARKEARTKTKAEAQSQSKFREPTPFTPEEEELLLNPQP